MLIKKPLRLKHWDSNSATFQGIFAIQDIDRSTKPVVVVLVMLLDIYFVTSIARARNNRYNLIYLSRAPKKTHLTFDPSEVKIDLYQQLS